LPTLVLLSVSALTLSEGRGVFRSLYSKAQPDRENATIVIRASLSTARFMVHLPGSVSIQV